MQVSILIHNYSHCNSVMMMLEFRPYSCDLVVTSSYILIFQYFSNRIFKLDILSHGIRYDIIHDDTSAKHMIRAFLQGICTFLWHTESYIMSSSMVCLL